MKKLAATLTVAASLALLLTSCTTPDEDPETSSSTPSTNTATETPTATARDVLTPPTFEAPTSAEQAIADAGEAVAAYYEAQVVIEASPDTNRDVLESFLIYDALEEEQGQVDDIIEYDLAVSGAVTFEPSGEGDVIDTTTGTDETPVPFGAATIAGCLDLSDYRVVEPGEEPFEWPADGRYEWSADTAFNPELGTWLITASTQGEGTC